MKTAISLPDELFTAADELAKRLGVSRSELYATAVAEYVAEYRSAGVRELLDRVYGVSESELDESSQALQNASLPMEEW